MLFYGDGVLMGFVFQYFSWQSLSSQQSRSSNSRPDPVPEENCPRCLDLLHQPVAQIMCRLAIGGSSSNLGKFANEAFKHIGGRPFGVDESQGVNTVVKVMELDGDLPGQAPGMHSLSAQAVVVVQEIPDALLGYNDNSLGQAQCIIAYKSIVSYQVSDTCKAVYLVLVLWVVVLLQDLANDRQDVASLIALAVQHSEVVGIRHEH